MLPLSRPPALPPPPVPPPGAGFPLVYLPPPPDPTVILVTSLLLQQQEEQRREQLAKQQSAQQQQLTQQRLKAQLLQQRQRMQLQAQMRRGQQAAPPSAPTVAELFHSAAAEDDAPPPLEPSPSSSAPGPSATAPAPAASPGSEQASVQAISVAAPPPASGSLPSSSSEPLPLFLLSPLAVLTSSLSSSPSHAPSPPSDPALLHAIHNLAEFVTRNGAQFEAVVRQRNPSTAPGLFRFLYEEGEEARYYRWKLQQVQHAINRERELQEKGEADMNPPPLSQPAIVESHQPSSVSSDATSRPHRPRSPEERERHRESHRPRPGADLRWLSGRRSRSRSPRRRAITPDRSSSPYRGDRQRRSPHRRQYRAEELREEESQERHRDWRGGEQRYDARPRSPPRHDTSAAPLHSSSPSSVQRMDDYVQRLSSTSSDEQRAAAEIPPLPTPTSSSHSSHTSRSRVSFHPSRNAPAASLSSASFRHASPTSSTPAAEVDESNVGHRMLKQLGWTEGQGLGRHRSGITAPIEAQQRPQGQGVGHDRRDTADAGGGDQYDAYKRQMQERYKHRPNPLGNPRHSYY